VRRERLGREQHPPAGVEQLVVRDGYLLDDGAVRGQQLQGAANGGQDLRRGCRILGVPGRCGGHPQPGHPVAGPGGGQVIGGRHRRGAWVARVEARDHLQRGRHVADRPADRAEVVEGVRQRADTGARDPAVGGLETDRATVERRAPDRTGGVGGVGHPQQPGRHRGAGTGRAAAGHVLAAPRIARRRHRQVEARAAERELVGGQLAEQDGAAVAQAHLDRAVGIGPRPGRAPRAVAGRQARDVDDVLVGIGDSVQQAAVDTATQLVVGRRRPGQRRLSGDQHEGVQLAVERGDAVEGVPGEFDRGQFPRAQQGRRLPDGELLERAGRGVHPGLDRGEVRRGARGCRLGGLVARRCGPHQHRELLQPAVPAQHPVEQVVGYLESEPAGGRCEVLVSRPPGPGDLRRRHHPATACVPRPRAAPPASSPPRGIRSAGPRTAPGFRLR
jgi:hypothetical protein